MVRRFFAVSVVVALSLLLASCNGGGTLEKIQTERMAYIGTVPFEAPLLYQKEGEMVGPDAELGERIVTRIDETRTTEGGTPVRLTWINRSYLSLGDALKNREIDFVLGVFTVTEERKKEFDFSDSYYTSELVMVINPVANDLRAAALGASKVGVREGTGVEALVRSTYPGANVAPYKTLDDAVLSLRRGEVDAVIDDKYLAAYSLATTPGVSFLEILPDTLGKLECAVATRKGDRQLMQLINSVVGEMKQSGDYARLIVENDGETHVEAVMARHPARLESERQATTPRGVSISVAREQGYDFDIYKMANLRFEFRSTASSNRIQSSPITFEGRVGRASAEVPPGDYSLDLRRFNFSTPVSIYPSDPDRVTINIVLGSGGVVLRRNP